MGAVDAAGAEGEIWRVEGRADRDDFSFHGDLYADSHGRTAWGGDAGCVLALAEVGRGGLSGAAKSDDCAGAGEGWDGGTAGGGLAGISRGESGWRGARGEHQYGLEQIAAAAGLAASDWAGVVVGEHRRWPAVHAGAARRA